MPDPINWRELLNNKLAPSKLSISKTFIADRNQIKITASYDPISKTGSFMVHINDLPAIAQNTSLHDDSIECVVFGTNTTSCTLDPKFPACTGCPLA